ncbi:MAG TPA: sugar phosphate nucleotidyltransferase [Candidatus Mcinerneyibacteriales bacterium]|nr:sugar phosphate nucleotidyltransferase [Candidatus Mcinerneyibacteriales bacterium]
MKIIIPAAGIGTRLRPHTHLLPKAMLQVAGRPIIGHIIDTVTRDLEVSELIIIVGYKKESLMEWVSRTYPGVPLRFVEQEEMLGLGHAVLMAEPFVQEGDELFIILGDTIVDMDLPGMVSMGCSALGTREVDDPRRFGVAEIREGMITRLVEKPDVPPSRMALMGVYYIKEAADLFRSIRHIMDEGIKTKNEYQITDALNHMIAEGIRMKPFNVDNWFDCGTIETLLETNRFLLHKMIPGKQEGGTGSVVIPPVFIGEGASVQGSVIGPDVSVGAHVTVRNSVIRDAIIYDNADIRDVIAEKSIFGTNCQVRGTFARMNTGPDTQLGERTK